MPKNLTFALQSNIIQANHKISQAKIEDMDDVHAKLKFLVNKAVSGVLQDNVAIRLTFIFCYEYRKTGNDYDRLLGNALTMKGRIQLMALSTQCSWQASRWVYSYDLRECSCVLTLIDGALHNDTEDLNFKDIVTYIPDSVCSIRLENLTGDCTSQDFDIKKIKAIPQITRFELERELLGAHERMALGFSISGMDKKPKLELSRYVGSTLKDPIPEISAPSYAVTFKEDNNIGDILNSRSEKLIYVIRLSVGDTQVDEATCTAQIMPPQINNFEMIPAKNDMVQVCWSTSYASKLWLNGEKLDEIDLGSREFNRSRGFVNLTCTGFKYYISSTHYFPECSFALLWRLCQTVRYEHETGNWEMSICWDIGLADSVSLQKDNQLPMSLQNNGILKFSGIQEYFLLKIIIKSGAKTLTIPLQM